MSGLKKKFSRNQPDRFLCADNYISMMDDADTPEKVRAVFQKYHPLSGPSRRLFDKLNLIEIEIFFRFKESYYIAPNLEHDENEAEMFVEILKPSLIIAIHSKYKGNLKQQHKAIKNVIKQERDNGKIRANRR